VAASVKLKNTIFGADMMIEFQSGVPEADSIGRQSRTRERETAGR
jgi:hypothetical protein